jgi:hypothetical protein
MKKNLIATLLFSLFVLLTCATTQAQDKTNYLLFVRNDGTGAVGYLERNGIFVQTQTLTNLPQNLSRVVSTEEGIYFYRNDGLYGVGQIDRGGQLNALFSPPGSEGTNFTHIINTGRHLLFVRNDGNVAVMFLTRSGSTYASSGTFYSTGSGGRGWTHVVNTNDGLFFYRASDGAGAVGYLDPNGGRFSSESAPVGSFVLTQSFRAGSFTTGWTKIVSTGRDMFFYRNDGLGAVANINRNHRFVQTQSFPIGSFATGFTHIVDTGRYLFFYRASDATAMLGRIDGAGLFATVQLYAPGYFYTDYDKIVEISGSLLFYRADGFAPLEWFGFGGEFNSTEQLSLDANLTHIVKVSQQRW